jgi:hypothetical protein
MTLFPTLLRIEAALEKLPAFITTRPENQSDAPKTPARTATTANVTGDTTTTAAAATAALAK